MDVEALHVESRREGTPDRLERVGCREAELRAVPPVRIDSWVSASMPEVTRTRTRTTPAAAARSISSSESSTTSAAPASAAARSSASDLLFP